MEPRYTTIACDPAPMFLYEIKTFDGGSGVSLEALIRCSGDLAAIFTGRKLANGGKAVEVWRDGELVYRAGLSPRLQEGIGSAMKGGRQGSVNGPLFDRFGGSQIGARGEAEQS